MIWFIMFILLFIVVIACVLMYTNFNYGGWVSLTPFFGWIILLIVFSILNKNNCNLVDTKKIALYSGNNGNEIASSFFLGSGSVDETDYVYYWTKDENGILTKNKLKMSDSKFIEDGNQYLEVTSEYCTSIFYADWTPNKYLFHVPENSVAQMYIFR